jgi:hypothetical protein
MMPLSIKSLVTASAIARVVTMSSSSDTAFPFSSSAIGLLFDDLVCWGEDARRNCQPNLLRRFQIDHQLEFSRLLYWQIGGLSTFQDFVYVSGSAANI